MTAIMSSDSKIRKSRKSEAESKNIENDGNYQHEHRD